MYHYYNIITQVQVTAKPRKSSSDIYTQHTQQFRYYLRCIIYSRSQVWSCAVGSVLFVKHLWPTYLRMIWYRNDGVACGSYIIQGDSPAHPPIYAFHNSTIQILVLVLRVFRCTYTNNVIKYFDFFFFFMAFMP